MYKKTMSPFFTAGGRLLKLPSFFPAMSIQEGKATFIASTDSVVSKEMDVFYNPAMKLNRDISVLLLNAIDNQNMRIADILAGSGVRSIRFLLEVNPEKINTVVINDHSEKSFAAIKKNLSINKVKNKKVIISNKDASLLLMESEGFEYIDVDPFGFPGRFLDASAMRISRQGILAVTATDIAALAGSSPLACTRKYWAKPLRNEFMHETGLRILIRRVQLIGAQYDKAFTPVLSYYKDHYMRVFFRCEKGKQKVDKIIKQHAFASYCRKCLWRTIGSFTKCSECGNKTEMSGPEWIGNLSEIKLVKKMRKMAEGEAQELLRIIENELKIKEPYFYDVHKAMQKYKKGPVPKHQAIIDCIRKKGYKAEYTHFRNEGIKSTIGIKELAKILNSL